jgi:hypothetical protein
MNRNPSLRVAVIGFWSIAALSLLQCGQTPSVVGNGSGGANGQGGAVPGDAAVTGNGGSSGGDTPVVTFNLDVIPVWWGASDAIKEPDAPPPPSIDANCGIVSSDTVRKPADIMLVLDRSASMEYSITADCYCAAGTTSPGTPCPDTTSCKTRWSALKPAVSATLANSNYVNWGLKYFPTGTGNASNCAVSRTVEVAVAPESAAAVQTQVNSATFALSTPTKQALVEATNYLKSLADTNKKFILLATDGEPNCGGSPASISTVDVEGAATAAEDAKNAGFPVYVVGIGPNLANLSKIAEKGGTTDYYPVTTPEQLVEALSSISKTVGSCTFTSSKEPPDPENVAVYVNKQRVERSNDEGWMYGASEQEIVLTGIFCEKITAGEDTSVQILFGCPGAPPFPPFVP